MQQFWRLHFQYPGSEEVLTRNFHLVDYALKRQELIDLLQALFPEITVISLARVQDCERQKSQMPHDERGFKGVAGVPGR